MLFETSFSGPGLIRKSSGSFFEKSDLLRKAMILSKAIWSVWEKPRNYLNIITAIPNIPPIIDTISFKLSPIKYLSWNILFVFGYII